MKYEGEWVESKKNGFGVEIFDNKEYYAGYFRKGEMSMLGKLESRGQYIYSGEWKSNKFHGLVSENRCNIMPGLPSIYIR